MLEEFFVEHPQHRGALQTCLVYPTSADSSVTYFNLSDRTYSQTLSEAEVAFLKAKVPLVKFVPRNSGPWLVQPA
jgi:hypothetical protein